MYLIDTYAHTNRWRRWHTLEKLVLSAGMLLLSLILPPWPGAALVFAAMTLLTTRGAGVPFGFYARLLLPPLGFILASAAALAVSVTVGPRVGWHVSFSPTGAAVAYPLLLRSLGATSSLYLLALTTPVVDLLSTLRRWGLPQFVLDLMLLSYRFLFVLTDTARAMGTAQASRLGYGDLRTARHSLGLLIASLIRRVLVRANRLEQGLAARGYDGNLAVLSPEQALAPANLGRIVTLELLVVTLSLYLKELWTWPR